MIEIIGIILVCAYWWFLLLVNTFITIICAFTDYFCSLSDRSVFISAQLVPSPTVTVSDSVGGHPAYVWYVQLHIAQLAPRGSFIAFFPPSCKSFLSYDVLFCSCFKRSITTMAGGKRSCRSRSETQCTFLKRMKVRTAQLLHAGSWQARVYQDFAVLFSSCSSFYLCFFLI